MTDALMYTDANGDAHVVGIMSDNSKDIKYGNTNVEDALNTLNNKIDDVNAKIQRKEFLNTSSISFSNIPQTCTGLLLIRGYSGNPQNWVLASFNIYAGTPAVDNNPLNLGSDLRYPTSASYSNGTLTFNLSASGNVFGMLIYSA